MNSAAKLLFTSILLVFDPAASAEALPADALALVRQVHAASLRKDLPALKAVMSAEFTWSFGGDASAEQAIQEWTARPGALAQLARVTAMPCAHIGPVVECPRNAGDKYRAGFEKTRAGWRMVYFVAGD